MSELRTSSEDQFVHEAVAPESAVATAMVSALARALVKAGALSRDDVLVMLTDLDERAAEFAPSGAIAAAVLREAAESFRVGLNRDPGLDLPPRSPGRTEAYGAFLGPDPDPYADKR